MNEIEIQVQEIKKGDRFEQGVIHYWTAIADAWTKDGWSWLDVQYVDGGTGTRAWDDPTMTLAVTRMAS